MINIYSTALAKVLKQWREDFGYTVSQVAKKLDASPHTIARFESGKGGISLEVGLKYLDFATTKMSTNTIWKQYVAELKTAKEKLLENKMRIIPSPMEGVNESLTPSNQEILPTEINTERFEDSAPKTSWLGRFNPFK